MSVTFVRKEVTDRKAKWRKVEDCVAGSDAVRKYIEDVNSFDQSAENVSRNAKRRNGAVFFNATERTLSALTGIAFSKWPEIVADGIEYVRDDANGKGSGIVVVAQSAIENVLKAGRCGALVDFPTGVIGASKAEEDAGFKRAVICLYAASSIINWATTKVGSKVMLSMLVLEEEREIRDGFELNYEKIYRELSLDDGLYVQRVWSDDGKGKFVVTEEYAPTMGNGQRWTEIPFAFIGSKDNSAEPDDIPLLPLVEMNLAHLTDSADHQESLFFAGQAQPVIWGVNENWLKVMKDHGMYTGSRAPLALPEGGGATLLQAQAVSGLKEEMDTKVELMASLGARLVQNGQVTKTATQAGSEDKTSHSVLSLCADNVSQALTRCLVWIARFMRANETVSVNLPTEYAGLQFDPQQLAQALALSQAGKLPDADLFSYLRNIGLIDATKSDDEIMDELEGAQNEAPQFDEVDGTAEAV